MDNLAYLTFNDPGAELRQFPTSFDFSDVPLTSTSVSSLQSSYPISNPSSDGSPSGLDFNLANNFWGCPFNNGGPNAGTCGRDIRQAIAHLIDKNAFISKEDTQLIAIDDPGGQVNSPDPCAWDSTHGESGSGCIVNGAGNTAYHLAPASSGAGCSNSPTWDWTPGCGTPDFCAAADHLIAAGLASGKDPTTCVLTGLSSGVTSNRVHLYYRTDNFDLNLLGGSVSEAICGVFTGTFSATGCGPLAVDSGSSGGFTGFTMTPGSTTPNLTWWIYTGGDTSYAQPASDMGDEHIGNTGKTYPIKPPSWEDLMESVIEFFVSGAAPPISGSQSCKSNISFYAATNYIYLCDPSYDSIANQMATSPCFGASGDPSTGQTHLTVTFANCPGTTQLTATSAEYQAEDKFGQNAYSIPIYIRLNQYVYPSSWSSGATPTPGRAINTWLGLFGYFNWLNAYSAAPLRAGYITQALSQSPKYLNPYAAFNPSDLAVLTSIYDSLAVDNPSDNSQLIDWMVIRIAGPMPNAQLSYLPPSGTVATYRYTLRNDMYWQDGSKVTAWDAKFSLASLRAKGSIFAAALSSLICTNPATCVDAVTVLSPTQFDVHVSYDTSFTKALLSSVPILPGKYWSPAPDLVEPNVCNSQTWQQLVSASNVPDSCMVVGRVTSNYPGFSNCPSGAYKSDPCFDPIYNSVLIGSGPWMCAVQNSPPGGGCSSNGTQNPGFPAGIGLLRNGIGNPPGTCLTCYFRSSGNLALWAWSQDTGTFSNDFLNFGAVSLCFGKPVGTSGCTVWQHGIGGSAAGSVVGLAQVSIVQRFVGVAWVFPFDWALSPPTNIATFPPVLFEGSSTLLPCSLDATKGYDC